MLKTAHDAEEFYEDRGARISILAGRRPPRPDTLKQTDQPSILTKPLADGAGHTFSTLFVDSRHRLDVSIAQIAVMSGRRPVVKGFFELL